MWSVKLKWRYSGCSVVHLIDDRRRRDISALSYWRGAERVATGRRRMPRSDKDAERDPVCVLSLGLFSL